MPLTRQHTCTSTSGKLLAAAAPLASIPAVIGLDGFVDEIIAVVDKRIDKDHYEAVKTIAALGNKILKAAGQSSNYELLVKQTKLGGNGPNMAHALASAGLAVTYVGNLGYPALHPVFKDFAKQATVISFAEPGHTDALEFDDGKLMLGKHQTLADVNWANMMRLVGKEKLASLSSEAKLIGMVNWTMLPCMSDIWKSFQAEILPLLDRRQRIFFVDLADPEKRTPADLLEALKLLAGFQEKMDVILGLNLKEAGEVAHVLGLPAPADTDEAIQQASTAIRRALNINTVVVHPRRGAGAANAEGSAFFHGPMVAQPKISTGAGDHFNAGFCIGRVLGFGLEESLCTGCGTSGYYVRTAQSPTAEQLAQFIATLPAPENPPK